MKRKSGAQVAASKGKKGKDASPAWGRSSVARLRHAVEDDISMVMRQRVVRGYGLRNVRDVLSFLVHSAD